MNTKDRILQAALALYNQEGIRSVTTRHIAAAMAISPGNLHYHFKHTEDIIQALFGQLTTAYDQIVQDIAQHDILTIEELHQYIDSSFHLIETYRFIFINFVELASWIPRIREAYQQLVSKREQEFSRLFNNLAHNGVFRTDISSTLQNRLVRQLFLISDFWISANELTGQLRGEEALAVYREDILSIFVPYLN